MKRALFILFIFFFTFHLFGQDKGQGSKPPFQGEIIGKVIDGATEDPLEYANVIVYRLPDSTMVTGGITGKNGEFQFSKITQGRYYVVVNFIGYTNSFSKQFALNNTNPLEDLGRIRIEMKAEVLKSVEITAEREAIEFKIDKKVVNVDKFYTSTSGTAVDVLENVPSVSVDASRNVSIRGSSSFTVLVDGRPTVMEASDVLEQYPASSIEKIEIITNPSAKYDPEGTTGIINIVTKKQKQQGISGIANVNVGMYDVYGADILVQVKNKISTWYVGADYNHRNNVGTLETFNSTSYSDTVNTVGGNGDFSSPRKSASVRAGVDFKLSNKNYWLIEGSIQKADRNRKSEVDYLEAVNDIIQDEYSSINQSSRTSSNWNINSDYTHKFLGDDHKFTWQISWSDMMGDEFTLNELFEPTTLVLNSGVKNTEVGPNTTGQTRFNYEKKVNDSLKYEVGYQATLDKSTDDFGTLNYDPNSSEYLPNDSADRTSSFFRLINAPYALVAGTKRKLGYQFALRTEFTNRNISIVGNSQVYEINRIDLFPTLHFSYELPKKHQLMMSYSRRIQRPRPWNLEPYVVARNQWSYRSGNPNLAPEYIDAFEIGYQKRFGKIFFSAEGYYRFTHDKVEQIQQAYIEKGPGVTLSIPENVGSDQALGIELMIKSPIFEWWEINLMGNFFNYRVTGSYTDVINDVTYSFDNANTNYSIRLNQTFSVYKNTKLQLNGNWMSPSVSAQGNTSGFVSFSAAIRMDVIPSKLAFTLQGQNIFNTAFHESFVSGPGLESRSYMKMAGPVFTFTATYKLNNYVSKKNREGQGSGESDE